MIVALIFLLSGSLIFRPSTTRKKVVAQAPTLTTGVSPTISSAPSATATVTTAPTKSKAEFPAQVFNLTNWKITLPTGSSGHPDEVKQPELNKFKVEPWFIVASDGGVRFRAAVNGVTTSGSKYPRSELREMTNNGADRASWSSTSGTHTMFIEEAITAVPGFKKHVVAGQIHDANDDILVIRFEQPNLYVNVGGKNMHTLDSSYTLGKKFSVKLVVTGGEIKVYYNDSKEPVYTVAKNLSGLYFKAGAYTQSNCVREILPFICDNNNFGEVVVYKLDVSHT